ncbi:MAG TPA: hypothetical protein PK821_03030 [Victivallales bacterium]|nr:hypothetical protein [Victivallales bacterium]
MTNLRSKKIDRSRFQIKAKSHKIILAPFSLLELLVVFTIIAMLAGIMIPSLSRSRKQAHRTNCVSNLKQITIAAKMYSQEQGFFPEAYREITPGKIKYWCTGYDGANANFSGGAMADYISSPELLKCPAFTDYTPLDGNKVPISSYGINAEYVGGSPMPGSNLDEILNSPPARLEEIKRPEMTVIFTDSASMSGDLKESWYFWSRYSYATGAELEPRVHFRHQSRAVAAFCDGHCEDSLKPDAIANETNKIGWLERELCERY